MHLNSDEKVEIFEKYGKGKTDTGSPEAQIALFSVRISHLTSAPEVKVTKIIQQLALLRCL